MFRCAARLADARLPNLSLEGRFTSAYNVSHSAALAALRWHGYRRENRYTVFQCLAHTVNWPPARWRVLDTAHQRRNPNEYEGYLEIDAPFVDEVCALVDQLIQDVQKIATP